MNPIVLLLFIMCSGSAPPSDAAEKGLWVATKINQADSGWKDEQVHSLMILRTAQGREVERVLRTRSMEVEGDGDKSLVIFDRPGDIKGTVFLTHAHKRGNDDQWLYLPALSRVKRISSSNRSGPFMGSEFAYEDISSEEVERYDYRFLREDQCGEELTCYVFERFPVDSSSGYSKQIVYADKEHFRIFKIEYFDRKAEHQKTLTRSNYQKFGDYWRASHWEMKNHRTQKSTTLIWKDRVFGSGLNERDFGKNALKRTQ